jgi:Fe2+ or Zn2+ uptake regulation protein
MREAASSYRQSAEERAAAMLHDLKQAGLKMTAQRIAIVKLFAGEDTHPTAQDLFERLRPDFPSMSFATVYNTLDALVSAGLSGTLRLGGAARFDPNVAAHHHAVCDRCGNVRDVPAETLVPTAKAVERLRKEANGFSVRAIERVYRGLCAKCAGGRPDKRPNKPEESD